jgi:hypothetical protein
MSEYVPLCVHCTEQYLVKEEDLINIINDKKIFKDQCTKCYNDAVNFLFLKYIIIILNNRGVQTV